MINQLNFSIPAFKATRYADQRPVSQANERMDVPELGTRMLNLADVVVYGVKGKAYSSGIKYTHGQTTREERRLLTAGVWEFDIPDAKLAKVSEEAKQQGIVLLEKMPK